MPELPEVETTCAGIAAHLTGKRIQRVRVYQARLRWPVTAELAAKVEGQHIRQISRRGKYILLAVADGHILIHLGMSGSLRIVRAGEEREKHDHFDLCLDNGTCLRLRDPRRFGAVLWSEQTLSEHPLLKDLGPEPLERNFDGGYLHAKALGRKVSIKEFIMNSHVVVGVGNIYANEALFLAGINPTRQAGRVSGERYAQLVKTIKQVLRQAIKQGGTTLRDFVNSEGKPGYFKQKLKVYDRAGEPCLQCGTTIKLIRQGQRSSFYCPHCQK